MQLNADDPRAPQVVRKVAQVSIDRLRYNDILLEEEPAVHDRRAAIEQRLDLTTNREVLGSQNLPSSYVSKPRLALSS